MIIRMGRFAYLSMMVDVSKAPNIKVVVESGWDDPLVSFESEDSSILLSGMVDPKLGFVRFVNHGAHKVRNPYLAGVTDDEQGKGPQVPEVR